MRLGLLYGIICYLSVLKLAHCNKELTEAVYESIEEWLLWKSIHSKNYGSNLEDLEKHIVWRSNKAYVDQHNINAKKGIYSYEVKLNHLGDMTDKDYHDKYLSYKKTDWSRAKETGRVKFYTAPKVSSWPDSIDWRTRGAVTNIKYQGNCGASYAFATTGALEGTYSLTYDRSARDLSEQNLIDCSVTEGNNGCNGGDMFNSFMYIIFNDGIDTARSYSYVGKQKTCNFTSKSIGASMSGIIAINSGSESDLQAAVTYAGPVAAAVDAKSTGFKFYSGGVFDTSYCSTYDINHAMLVVGYGTYTTNGANKDYWILKNSWGEDWGIEGYIWMARNKYNQCGIATDCSYPSM